MTSACEYGEYDRGGCVSEAWLAPTAFWTEWAYTADGGIAPFDAPEHFFV